tara:strand:+ start:2012 stop:2779 length:768 start_codon:yes stop_codon:yes gene_type:complete
MVKLIKSQVDILALSGAERTRFFDEWFDLYDEIFDGFDRPGLEAYYGDPNSSQTRMQVMRTADGKMVGFNAVRLYPVEIDGKERDAFRSTAGMKREYRGGSSTIAFGLQLAVAYKIKHPFRAVYYFGSMLHPSSYYVLSKYAYEMWPRHDREPPPIIDRLIATLAEMRDYEFDDPPSPYVRLANERTREAEDEPEFWRTSDNPIIRYYVETNPRYAEGRGLITLVPLTWTNLILSSVKFGTAMLGRKLGLTKKRR